MSVINKMLQDLEQRRGPGGEGGMPVAGVRAVAVRNGGARIGWGTVALVAALAATSAVLAWLLLRQQMPVPAAPQVNARVVLSAPVISSPTEPAPDLNLTSPHKADFTPLPSAATASRPVAPENSRPRSVGGGAAPAKAFVAVAPVIAGSSRNETGTEAAGKPAEQHGFAPVKRFTPQQQADFSCQKAVALLQQGRVEEAQHSLGEVLKAVPDHLASRQTLAGILVERKQYAQAEQLLREGLDFGADQPEFVMALARLQVERGDVRGALDTLEKILAAAREHAAYQSFLAALQQRQGQHRQAIEHYLAALRLAPASPSALVGLGISLQAENRLADAQEAFGRAKYSGGLSPELQGFVEQRLKQIQLITRQ